LIALGAGLLIGFLAQRSRFCTVGAFRDVVLMRDMHLFNGVLALLVAAVITNLALGQFKAGFAEQPVAHTNMLWNFGGMVLAGLAFTLAGGCPGRQVFLSGEGDGDASIFVFGMIAGAGVAHTFSLASSPAGPGAYSAGAVIVGLLILSLIGLTMRETRSA
jgi:YedE family putative selenium metabolism protein